MGGKPLWGRMSLAYKVPLFSHSPLIVSIKDDLGQLKFREAFGGHAKTSLGFYHGRLNEDRDGSPK